MEIASTVTAGASATRLNDTLELVGRVTLALIFVLSGSDKLFFHTAGNVEYMRAVHVPLAGLLVYVAGAVEFGAGILLAVGYQARIAAALLAAFTVVATPLFHNFWATPAEQAVLQTIMFMKNLAIFGGLLLVVVHGAGRLALNRR